MVHTSVVKAKSLNLVQPFPEPQRSLWSSQKPATDLYPQPNESNPCLYTYINTFLRSAPGCCKWSLSYPVKLCTDAPSILHVIHVSIFEVIQYLVKIPWFLIMRLFPMY